MDLGPYLYIYIYYIYIYVKIQVEWVLFQLISSQCALLFKWKPENGPVQVVTSTWKYNCRIDGNNYYKIVLVLVGGWPTPLKNMRSSVGMIRHSQLNGKIKVMFQTTTNQLYQTSLNPMKPPFSYGFPMVSQPVTYHPSVQITFTITVQVITQLKLLQFAKLSLQFHGDDHSPTI